ncbi:MAG TPA: phosphodiester glycosidase family protein [Kofleriaceae bacterium]|nr:phosphodiester glycosidase family protein [Kofleriaceae bacterium]
MRCAYAWIWLLAGCGRHEPAPAAPPPKPPPPRIAPAAAAPAHAEPCSKQLVALGPGLFASREPIDAKPATGDGACLDIVRAELASYRLRVLTASRDGHARTAPDWRDTFDLAAVINAGMFHDTGAPVGLLVENGIAVGSDNASFGGVLAFDPRSPDDPPVAIAGRGCRGFDLADLRERYRSLVQSSRLLGCDGTALRWKDRKQYSAAAIGVDRSGRVVLLHARSAVTMTELSRVLASPELDLAGAIFLEGGPEASLLVRGRFGSIARVGSYETNFREDDTNQDFWQLPNVIALEPR